MKQDLRALAGPFYTLLLFAAALLLAWGAVASGHAEMLVPTPENVATGFVHSLRTHRYPAALDRLSQEVRADVSENDLRDIEEAIEKNRGAPTDDRGQGDREQGEEASARVKAKFEGGEEEVLTFPLVKEEGLWKVSSLAPLRRLAR